MRGALTVLAVAVLAMGCGGASNGGSGAGSAGSAGGGGANVVQFGGAVGNAFSPSSLTIAVGDTVTWQGDFASHPLVSGPACGQSDGAFSSSSGTTFSHQFTAAGTYPYHCDVHCSMGMTGEIIVR